MKPGKTYLKGRSIFIVSLMVIGVTAVTVYLTGSEYNRSITSNFYISLGIISIVLFAFLTYGLYKGIEIVDNRPNLKGFSLKDKFKDTIRLSELPEVHVSDNSISGLIISFVLWLLVSAAFIVLLMFVQTFLWFSIAIILAMLYWIFFRALRLVFAKAYVTENDLGMAAIYAFAYTFMYVAWMFGIVYVTTLFK